MKIMKPTLVKDKIILNFLIEKIYLEQSFNNQVKIMKQVWIQNGSNLYLIVSNKCSIIMTGQSRKTMKQT